MQWPIPADRFIASTALEYELLLDTRLLASREVTVLRA